MLRSLGHEPPHVPVECGSVMTIRQLLLAGDGLSLLSPDQLSVELQAGLLVSLPAPAPVERIIGITTRIGWRPTAAQAAFLAVLRQVGDGMRS
jgi:LysR family transcriptional regulator of gallate degradation